MKIHYLATSNIPSKTANSLQISKMCDAFFNIGHSISLIVPNFKSKKISVKEYYDIKNNFKIYKVGTKVNKIKGIDNILVPIKILKKSFNLGSNIVLTRNLVISLILITTSLILLIFKGLNYGVDFKGGTLIEIRVEQGSSKISLIV